MLFCVTPEHRRADDARVVAHHRGHDRAALGIEALFRDLVLKRPEQELARAAQPAADLCTILVCVFFVKRMKQMASERMGANPNKQQPSPSRQKHPSNIKTRSEQRRGCCTDRVFYFE